MTQPIDDFFYASVDGLRQKIWFIGDPEQNGRIDATSWFGAGTHTLRLQAINTGGPASYGVRVWINDAVALEESCPPSVCNGQNTAEGILFDRSLTIETPNQPPTQVVRVTSETPGKLYIGDGFTGLTTTGSSNAVSVSLPPGQYTFGLGVNDDTPPVYGGSYRERTVSVGSSAVDVSFASTPALPTQDETRIVVVPVRTLTADPFNQSTTGCGPLLARSGPGGLAAGVRDRPALLQLLRCERQRAARRVRGRDRRLQRGGLGRRRHDLDQSLLDDFALYQRVHMRGQVAELNTTRPDVNVPSRKHAQGLRRTSPPAVPHSQSARKTRGRMPRSAHP